MERALFFFLLLRVINGVKSPYKKKNYHPENKTSLNKPLSKRPSILALTEVLNEGIRFKLVSRVILLFDINTKVRRSPGNNVAYGLNWMKESWDNAPVRINSALIVFTPCFSIGSFCAIIR